MNEPHNRCIVIFLIGIAFPGAGVLSAEAFDDSQGQESLNGGNNRGVMEIQNDSKKGASPVVDIIPKVDEDPVEGLVEFGKGARIGSGGEMVQDPAGYLDSGGKITGSPADRRGRSLENKRENMA